MTSVTGAAGFTLAEMAVVTVIAGLILVALLPALIDMRRAGQLTATQTNLQTLLRATAAYAQAHGCLPCPAPAAMSSTGFGRVRGDGAANVPACGACANPGGIAPFSSLGIDPAAAKDGWGRWITMHIDPALAQNFGVVPPHDPCADNDAPPCSVNNKGQSVKGMCRSGLLLDGRVTVKTILNFTGVAVGSSAQAAVIFVSHGNNGFGAYAATAQRLAFPVQIPACAPNAGFERCNADGDKDFYLLDRGLQFDDVIAYAGRNMLVSMFGNGACATAW